MKLITYNDNSCKIRHIVMQFDHQTTRVDFQVLKTLSFKFEHESVIHSAEILCILANPKPQSKQLYCFRCGYGR